MDVKVRNKKTGEEKVISRKLAEMLKNKYVIVSEEPEKVNVPQVAEVVTSQKKEGAVVEAKPVVHEQPQEEPKLEGGLVASVDVPQDAITDITEKTPRELYKEKFGKPAPGRMSEEKIVEALNATQDGN